jgi:hypothetical protein
MIIALFRCAVNDLTGGGSDLPDKKVVTGKVVSADKLPAGNTQVMLIPADFNYINGPSIPAEQIDTTDSEGVFHFSRCKAGDYNIQAVHLTQRTRLLITGLTVSEDTTRVQVDTLRSPGTVKVFFPNEIGPAATWIYFPGTNIAAQKATETDFVVLDSVPAGKIPRVCFLIEGDSVPSAIRYNLVVPSGDTTVVAKPAWHYSRQLFLNTKASGANVNQNVVNFPVLVRLNSDNFDFLQAKDKGEDIRFTKPDDTFLPYEIERWDATNKRAEIWVKVDTVAGNDSTQSITMYWGNAAASDSSNGNAVFDTSNNVTAIWHLNQNCTDASGNRYNGMASSATDTPGIIGFCKKFNGNDSIRIAGLLAEPSSITLSAWAQLDSASPLFCGSEILSIGDAVFIRMDYNNGSLGTGGAVHASNDTTYSHFGSGQFLKQSGWHLITFTLDETFLSPVLYIDGLKVDGLKTTTGTVLKMPINYSGAGQNTYIGKHGNGKTGFGFSGRIDEVRVYRTAISADYIKLSYMNQKEKDDLVTFK